MAKEFFIPKLGQTVEEVTLVRWLVEDGAEVSQGQEVLEVETDKAIFPVESNGKGILHRGPFEEGDVLPVLKVVAIIGGPGDKFVAGEETDKPAVSDSQPEAAVAPSPAPTAPSTETVSGRVFASPRARKLAAAEGVDLARVSPSGGNGTRVVERDVATYLMSAPKSTPLAQKMAADAGVDLNTLTGSGPAGKIMKADVARAIAPAAISSPLTSTANLPIAEVIERVPLKGVRAIIAERMAASVHTSARVTLITEVDATAFVEARTRIKERVEEEWGFAPGYNDLLARIVSVALREHPYMNARLAADAIEWLGHINLGMAMDTERGLLVPVIQDADRKSLRELGIEFRELVERARAGRSLPDDLTGGTFTITNLGSFGIDAFTPIINLPEAAILGVGRIAPRPVAVEGAVEVRSTCTLSLVFDHRLTDGAPAARFLQTVSRYIEEPYLLLAV